MQTISEEEFMKKAQQAQEEVIPDIPVVVTPRAVTSPGLEWWLVDELASNGKLYSPELYVRTLNVTEIKKLALMGDEKTDEIIYSVLNSATRGIDIDDLAYADSLHLMLHLRNYTYSNEKYVIETRCPICKTDHNIHIGMNDIEINHLSDDYDPSEEYELSSGDKVSVRFMTVRDVKESRIIVKESKIPIDKDDLVMAYQINTINGEVLSIQDKYRYVATLRDGLSYTDLLSITSEFDFGIKPVFDVKCPNSKCPSATNEETYPFWVSFHPDFFVPKRRFK